MYPKKFENLINAYSKLPGVGRKSAERYAFTTLDWDKDTLHALIQSLEDIDKGIKHCKICGNMSDSDTCSICSDMNRNKKIICIVENIRNIEAMEKMEEYNGVYHVLNGLINTNKGILPENLNIDSLLDRITNDTDEIIIALDPTIEGETTTLYLTKLLAGKCKITTLARGIPLGSHIDYADSLTLLKSFENRK